MASAAGRGTLHKCGDSRPVDSTRSYASYTRHREATRINRAPNVVGDGATQAAWTGLAFAAFDEFGNPLQMAGSGSTTGPPARYGWLGGTQRSADAFGGVILMGQRLYLPSTGRFLSVDPVPGGSANSYDYCNADPVNCTDLNGSFSLTTFASVVVTVASVASMIPGPVGMAASAVSVVAYVVAGDKKQALIAAAGIALAAVGAGAAVAATHANQLARAGRAAVSGFKEVANVTRANRAVLSDSKLWRAAFDARGVGSRSRLFGDVHSGASQPGLLNRGPVQIGWSGARVAKVNGKYVARTVFRVAVKITSNVRHVNIGWGPWRHLI